MSRQDDIAAAELAGFIGGQLNVVDKTTICKSSTGSALRIHPAEFLTSIRTPTQTTNSIASYDIINEPKSRPSGSEIVGIESVDLKELMIPMDTQDTKMKKAIQYHTAPITCPTEHVHTVSPLQSYNPSQSVNDDTILKMLKTINNKLDLIMKHGKIQPRYKKRKL